MASHSITVNGRARTVESADPDQPLLYILRNGLEPTGPKYGCGLGQCGACTVIVDGEARRSCRVAVPGAAAPVGAALANGVFAASGDRLRTVPFAPERVKGAIERGGA